MNDLNVKLAALMVEQYKSNRRAFKQCLATGKTHRKIMLMIYDILTNNGELIPIHILGEIEKSYIWDEIKEYCIGKVTAEDATDIAKCIHALLTITNV